LAGSVEGSGVLAHELSVDCCAYFPRVKAASYGLKTTLKILLVRLQ